MDKKKKYDFGEFLCPICGNELKKTDKPVIKCKWCRRSIVPEAIHFKRDADVYDNYGGQR